LGSRGCRIIEDSVPGLMSSFSLWQATTTSLFLPADPPLVDAMARTALPIQLKAVPRQDTNEITEFHTS
jgi:hypothetical protein